MSKDEFKELRARYGMSEAYFYKCRKKVNDDVEQLVQLCEAYKAKKHRVSSPDAQGSKGTVKKRMPDEIKQLFEKYKGKISSGYFYKCRQMTNGIEELEKKILQKIQNDENRKLRKSQPPKKKRVPVNPNAVPKNIPVPDHIMGRDEFYIYIRQHVIKSVAITRKKYYTLAQNNISNEDLVSEIFIKCIRPTRKGVTIYDKYLQNPGILATVLNIQTQQFH